MFVKYMLRWLVESTSENARNLAEGSANRSHFLALAPSGLLGSTPTDQDTLSTLAGMQAAGTSRSYSSRPLLPLGRRHGSGGRDWGPPDRNPRHRLIVMVAQAASP
jgi:hypothetical protein